MHAHYSIMSFDADPTLHLQAQDEREVLCGGQGAIAIPHLPVPTLMKYAPFEIGIFFIAGALDHTHMCESCASILDGILDLEDDLIEMEHGHAA